MKLRQFKRLLTLAVYAFSLTACSREGRHFTKHHILAIDGHPQLPPVAVQLPGLNDSANLLHPTRDSTTIAWLRPIARIRQYQAEDVALFHIYSVANRYYFTIYYPRPGGLYSKDLSFTAYMYRTKTTPELIEMTSSSVPYSYIRATHQWYFNALPERLMQVPPLKETNKYLAHYINGAKKTDTNTLVRFGDATMHRIYYYGSVWYLADYTKAGADISLLRKSSHPLGNRFDYANLDEQRAVFNLTLRPLLPGKVSAEEQFRLHTPYFVVSKSGMVYRFNPATNTVEDSVAAARGWQYKYSFYDSIFYCCPHLVDSVYKL